MKLVAICLICLAAGCARPAAPPTIQVESQEWQSPAGDKGVQLLTEHFDLRVTAADPLLREYLGPFMETAFSEYAKLVPPAANAGELTTDFGELSRAKGRRHGEEKPVNTGETPVPQPERLIVYLFDTRRQWAAFTAGAFPAQAYTYLHIQSGGYTDNPSAMAVAFDLGRDRTLSLLAHEGMHQYLARYFPEPVESWLNEGLACQWEAFDLHGNRPVFTPRRNFMRRNSLREALTTKAGLTPLPELFRMNAGHAIRQTGQPVRTYYAEVWSLVLFLREPAGGYADRFAALLADAGTPRLTVGVRAFRAATPDSQKLSDGEVIFRHYITEDLDGFMTQYTDFCRALVN